MKGILYLQWNRPWSLCVGNSSASSLDLIVLPNWTAISPQISQGYDLLGVALCLACDVCQESCGTATDSLVKCHHNNVLLDMELSQCRTLCILSGRHFFQCILGTCLSIKIVWFRVGISIDEKGYLVMIFSVQWGCLCLLGWPVYVEAELGPLVLCWCRMDVLPRHCLRLCYRTFEMVWICTKGC